MACNAGQNGSIAISLGENGYFGSVQAVIVDLGVGGSSPLSHPAAKYKPKRKLRYLPMFGSAARLRPRIR